jgi:hypothetical protein
MVRLARIVFTASSGLFIFAGLSGCGGGDSSSAAGTTDDFQISQSSTINENTSQSKRTSELWINYQNFRSRYGEPSSSGSFGGAIAYADFDGDGETDVFVAPGTSLYESVPFEFYRNLGDGSFELVTDAWIDGEIPELPHPRKSVVADFNDDGRPDILVVDHGPELEGEGSPGGHVWQVLSQEDGRYNASQITTRLGFYHGASAGDLNGDGLPDAFITDSPGIGRGHQPEIFLNSGGGILQRAPERLGSGVKNLMGMYTAEIYDLDEDGFADIIVAGHEMDGMNTRVLWGSPQGGYTLSRSSVLPGVSSWGTVVDIALGDINGSGLIDLVLTRTGGGDNNFYQGYYIQVIEQADIRAFSDITESALNGSGSDTGSNWISWTRLQDISNNGRPDILVDGKRFCLRWDNDGGGDFNLMTDACSMTF